jgi:RNA polymerase-binding transcription factor DksA
MGRHILVTCDLCKNNYEQEFIIFSFKRSNKKTSNKYEICEDCAEKLEQQLVASLSAKLPKSWGLSSKIVDKPTDPMNFTPSEESVDISMKAKHAYHKEFYSELQDSASQTQRECTHLNKGPIEMDTVKDIAFRVCKACQKQLPEKRKNGDSDE